MTSKSDYKSLNLTLNLPENWLVKLNQIAAEKEQSLEQLVIELLGKTLANQEQNQALQIGKKEDKKTTNTNESEVNDRLQAIEAKQATIDQLEERVAMLEKLMDSVQRQVTVRDYAGKLPPHLIDDSHNDLDDEPDEILTDFLD